MYFKSVLSHKWFAGLLEVLFLKKKPKKPYKKTQKTLEASFSLQWLLKSQWVEEELWCYTTWEPHLSCVFRVAFVPAKCSVPVVWQELSNGVSCCQVNLKYKQLLYKGAPVMPVTPNFVFLENAWPGQEEFTKQIVTHLLWVLCELVGKSAVFLQINAKMWKMDMWGVCSKRGERSLCVWWSGQKCWEVSLALTFSWGASILFHIHCPLPIPFLKRHRNARPPHQHLLGYCLGICVTLEKSCSGLSMFV